MCTSGVIFLYSNMNNAYLRHRVVPAAAPGVAGEDTPDSHAPALPGAVFFYSFYTIGTAGGCVPALSAQQWRYGPLVKAYQPDE